MNPRLLFPFVFLLVLSCGDEKDKNSKEDKYLAEAEDFAPPEPSADPFADLTGQILFNALQRHTDPAFFAKLGLQAEDLSAAIALLPEEARTVMLESARQGGRPDRVTLVDTLASVTDELVTADPELAARPLAALAILAGSLTADFAARGPEGVNGPVDWAGLSEDLRSSLRLLAGPQD